MTRVTKMRVARRRGRKRLLVNLRRRRRQLLVVEEVSCLKKRAQEGKVLWTGKMRWRRRRQRTSGPSSSETQEGLQNQNLNLLDEVLLPYWPPPHLQLKVHYLKVGLGPSLTMSKKAKRKLLVKKKL